LISTANSNKVDKFTIPSTLSEKVLDTTTLRFTLQMTVGTNVVSNTTTLLIESFVFTQLTNYSSSYTIFASDGLRLFPAFSYPECPVFKGPQVVPSSVNLGCSLYDSRGNLIKTLSVCGL